VRVSPLSRQSRRPTPHRFSRLCYCGEGQLILRWCAFEESVLVSLPYDPPVSVLDEARSRLQSRFATKFACSLRERLRRRCDSRGSHICGQGQGLIVWHVGGVFTALAICKSLIVCHEGRGREMLPRPGERNDAQRDRSTDGDRRKRPCRQRGRNTQLTHRIDSRPGLIAGPAACARAGTGRKITKAPSPISAFISFRPPAEKCSPPALRQLALPPDIEGVKYYQRLTGGVALATGSARAEPGFFREKSFFPLAVSF
jgi:hypothetical protein